MPDFLVVRCLFDPVSSRQAQKHPPPLRASNKKRTKPTARAPLAEKEHSVRWENENEMDKKKAPAPEPEAAWLHIINSYLFMPTPAHAAHGLALREAISMSRARPCQPSMPSSHLAPYESQYE